MNIQHDGDPNPTRLGWALKRAAALLADAENKTWLLIQEVRRPLQAIEIEPEYSDNKFASRVAQGMAKHLQEKR